MSGIQDSKPVGSKEGALSLQELCRKSIIRRIGTVYSVGNAPNHLLQEILDKVPNHRQLREIEKNSPHVMEITKPQWIRLIKRDFPNADIDAYIPQVDSKWYKCYAKHAAEHTRQENELVEKLKGQYNAISNSKEKHQTKLLDKTPYMPKAYRMGTGVGLKRVGDLYVRDQWNSAAGSRTKNLLTKIKREIAEKKIFTNAKYTTNTKPKISRDLEQKLVLSIPEEARKDNHSPLPLTGLKRKDPPTASPQFSSNHSPVSSVNRQQQPAGGSPPSLATRPAGNPPVIIRKSKEANCFMPAAKKHKIGNPK